MFGLPALIAGLVLLLAGSHWFSGAVTVGTILTVVGGLGVLIPLVIFIGATAFAFFTVKG